MNKYIIKGGNKLCGELWCPASKNALLPIIAASILCSEKVTIKNITYINDVIIMLDILSALGINVQKYDDKVIIDPNMANSFSLPPDTTRQVRASVFLLGPLIARHKFAITMLPGGCNIGKRPIDIHLKGFKALGVKVCEENGYIICDGTDAKSGIVKLDFPSVGATENIIMLSCMLKGKTTIVNAAKEPEIVDLQNFLNSMGANITGAGSDIITVNGVTKLYATNYSPIPDRIVAGTYLTAVAMTGGKLSLLGANSQHIAPVIKKLRIAGCSINIKNDKITLESDGKNKSFNTISTKPYPGFPTDMQPQMMAFATTLYGTSMIKENIFESRFKHADELKKMGADIHIKNNCAIINGVNKLTGTMVSATDLRAGSALVIAGLGADGYTIIDGINFVERGYKDLDKNLVSIGADIKKI